jgi:hypothetical protein
MHGAEDHDPVSADAAPHVIEQSYAARTEAKPCQLGLGAQDLYE